jgi:dynein heavy chain, axonemal
MAGKLDLVFFKEAIQHVLRISRVIFQERGNAMLVGVGGSGKQSLSKIAAYISSSKMYQLEMGRGYNGESFRGDLQKIAIASGVDEQKLCFLFVDTQIIYEEFL